MKTLYLHGLDSHPDPDKNKIMKKAGLELTALHINYREKLGVYETFRDTIRRKKIEFVIGSSLGGYIGNILAEDAGLPCLLFNPAMQYTDVFYSRMPIIEKKKCPARFVVLGDTDPTVNPLYSLKVFGEADPATVDQRILTCHWLGHQIDLRTVEDMLHWALFNLGQRK
jgi:hypothetical protein